MIKSISCLLALLFVSSVLGCGDDGNKVITPTEDYQLNEQEQANLKAEEDMRK